MGPSRFLDSPTPRAFAHRGWHVGDLAGLENTMPAFERAVAEGYRYLETDVHATADGVLVAFHDGVLDRVTDRTGAVSSTTWTDLQQARIAGREPIPTFEQVLELAKDHPQLRLNVDPKADTSVGPLLDALAGSGLSDRVLLGSFSDRRLRYLRKALGPDQATSMGPREILGLVRRSRISLGAPKPHRAVAAAVPLSANGIPVLTGHFVRRAHAENVEVHAWTIDDPATMERLLDLGVDGIMTDRPDLLRDVLERRGAWS